MFMFGDYNINKYVCAYVPNMYLCMEPHNYAYTYARVRTYIHSFILRTYIVLLQEIYAYAYFYA